MAYSKIRVFYHGDGISLTNTNARQYVQKKITLPLPQKVTKYGDTYGYNSISVGHYQDHIILKGGGETLMDVDFNGESKEYIRYIDRYEWL